MYDMKQFLEEGFNIYYDNQIGIVIEFKGKALFLPGLYSYQFKTEELMFNTALLLFSNWIVDCITKNDIDWWLDERLGGK